MLTFDVGTQSTRAMLVNKTGEIELSSKIQYESPAIQSDVFEQAEQYPEFYYNMVCESAKRLRQQDSENLFSRIVAVTLTCIRDTVLVLDKDRRPLRNIIVWMDGRRAPGKPDIPIWKRVLFAIVGMADTVEKLYKDSFYNWIKKCEPEIMAKTDKFVMLPGYINYLMTGELKDSVANQVGHIPFDNRKRVWMKRGLARCVADIPLCCLIDLVESGETIGYVTRRCSEASGIPEGLPLIATGTDKACEALGLSVISEGKAAVSLGTQATIQFCSKSYFEPQPFIPSFPSVIPGRFNAEYQIYRGYWTVIWFKEQFCQYEEAEAKRLGVCTESLLDRYLEEVPQGCNGLIMVPHMAPGTGNPNARAVLMGLSDQHTKKHLYRAIVEGINFDLYHAMKRMERRSAQKIKEIYIAGGGSQCDEILQITADMFGLPVKRIQTHEATGIGSSIAAFVGLGEFSSYEEATAAMVHDADCFIPDMKIHEKYKEIYSSIYKRLEFSVKGILRKIRKVFSSERN